MKPLVSLNWKFNNDYYHSVDDDSFYCDKLNRIVDLGWNEWTNMVHGWITILNKCAGELYSKHQLKMDTIKVNMHTFYLLKIDEFEYTKMNSSASGKLGHYNLVVDDSVPDLIVCVSQGDTMHGEIKIEQYKPDRKIDFIEPDGWIKYGVRPF